MRISPVHVTGASSKGQRPASSLKRTCFKISSNVWRLAKSCLQKLPMCKWVCLFFGEPQILSLQVHWCGKDMPPLSLIQGGRQTHQMSRGHSFRGIDSCGSKWIERSCPRHMFQNGNFGSLKSPKRSSTECPQALTLANSICLFLQVPPKIRESHTVAVGQDDRFEVWV